jgi:hypothetical protein
MRAVRASTTFRKREKKKKKKKRKEKREGNNLQLYPVEIYVTRRTRQAPIAATMLGV